MKVCLPGESAVSEWAMMHAGRHSGLAPVGATHASYTQGAHAHKRVQEDASKDPGLIGRCPEPRVRDHQAVVPHVQENDRLPLEDQYHRI
eukprot:COSAG01_NODE_1466_length_10220_cov_15.883608_7_plen_90_part_00